MADPRFPPIDPHTAGGTNASEIAPFLVSGGAVQFLVAEGFDPRPAGVQLLCYVYVPIGTLGILKGIRVAPFVPPPFADPYQGGNFQWWGERESTLADGEPIRPGSQNGVWETPLAWEGFYDPAERLPVIEWTWILKLIDGDIEDLRRTGTNIPPFSPALPVSWFLVPNIPVPAAAYAAGIPGRSPGSVFGPQRVQVLQGDGLDLSIPVPENKTIALFARWKQHTVAAYGRDDAGRKRITPSEFYPLLPSFGQLLGYMQPASRAAAREAAIRW